MIRESSGISELRDLVCLETNVSTGVKEAENLWVCGQNL